MTRYRSIQALQEPFDNGLDEVGRVEFVFNVLAWKAPSAAVLQELTAILVAAGVVAAGGVFATSKAAVPPGPGPFLSMTATGGAPPIGTHNEGPASWDRRPGAQIVARATSPAAAQALAHAAYNALVAVRNEAVSA